MIEWRMVVLKGVFEELDDWIIEENRMAIEQSAIPIDKCEFKVVGQAALLEARLDLSIAATGDLDVFVKVRYEVIEKLNVILKPKGMVYDILSSQIWMPDETEYTDIYSGEFVTATRALPEYILVSKAKHAARKNRDLIMQYLASGPPDRFFDLCEKYEIALDKL
jgi:hypothetical protein